MSRRTPLCVAAGLLAAALTAPPTLAQHANPWRGTTANPWRTAAADLAAEAGTPAPRPQRRYTLHFLTVPLGRTAPVEFPMTVSESRAEPEAAPAPGPEAAHVPAVMPGACCVSAERSAKLTGSWYRELPGAVTTVTLTGSDLKVTTVLNVEGSLATVTLTADCAVTRDGTLHGVVTGADVDLAAMKNGDLGMGLAELSLTLQELVDQPFAVRCRPCDGGLMLSNVRVPACEMKEIAVGLCGKYTAVTGKVPTPKPAPIINTYTSDPALLPQLMSAFPAPPPGRCESRMCPADAAIGVPTGPYPHPPLPAALPPGARPAPVRPCPPPEIRETMQRVFGEMLDAQAPPVYSPYALPLPPQVCAPPVSYPPACPTVAASPTSFVVPAGPPLSAAAPAGQPGRVPTGTWVREIGPMCYRIDARAEHLTVTMTLTSVVAGRPVSQAYVLIAEYHPARTDGEVVGLITAFDIAAGGSAINESEAMQLLKTLPEVQKAVAGKPLALTFRVYDDTLVIGNVRLPADRGAGDEATAVFAGMGGRYTRSTGGSPKPVAVTAGMTLPSPRDPEFPPQYLPAEPDPVDGLTRIGVDFNFNPPRFYGMEPVPTMPAPAPLPGVKKPNPFRNGGVPSPDAPRIPPAAR